MIHTKVFGIILRKKEIINNNKKKKKRKTGYNDYFPSSIESLLHSKLKGGIRTSINVPSSLSILNVLSEVKKNEFWKLFSRWYSTSTYPHMWPLLADRETCDEYWNAGYSLDNLGSSPTTPLPRTVSNFPDKLNIRQCRSRNVTTLSGFKFSIRMEYRHQYTLLPCTIRAPLKNQ